MMSGRDFEWARTAARKAVVGLGCSAVIGAAGAIVFWDVDFYAVRDKWEHFKIAMLGEWQSPDRRSAAGAPARPQVVPSVLEVARDITFFTTSPAKEHGIEVTTGVSFSTVADLLAAKQKSRWCYIVASPRSGLARQVELGRQSGSASPVYADLSVYPADELAVIGLSARTLQSLAKSHCRFAKGTTTAPSSKGEGRT